jgi:putative oxidoreductase
MGLQAQVNSVSVEADASRSATDAAAILIARLLMAQIFIVAGIRKILGWDATVKYIGTHLPMPDVLIYAVVALEVGGGILFALGWRTRHLAALLGAFTLLAALIFHPFWAVPDAQFTAQLNNFLKNVAITGGFLLFVVTGGGRFAVNRR